MFEKPILFSTTETIPIRNYTVKEVIHITVKRDLKDIDMDKVKATLLNKLKTYTKNSCYSGVIGIKFSDILIGDVMHSTIYGTGITF